MELLLGPDGRAGCRGAECWRVRDRSWEESEHSVGTAQPHRSQLSLSHFFQPWFICGVISFGEQSVLSGLQQEKKKCFASKILGFLPGPCHDKYCIRKCCCCSWTVSPQHSSDRWTPVHNGSQTNAISATLNLSKRGYWVRTISAALVAVCVCRQHSSDRPEPFDQQLHPNPSLAVTNCDQARVSRSEVLAIG